LGGAVRCAGRNHVVEARVDEDFPKIENLLCFYNEKVDLYVDGVLQERPVSPFS
jgi:hypothetical protein